LIYGNTCFTIQKQKELSSYQGACIASGRPEKEFFKYSKKIPKSKLTADDLRAMGGILKGQLISKEHLRTISWKKRNW
jgi:hypothetical protein